MMSEIVRSQTIEKEYYAQVDGIITPEAVTQLENGVEIGFKGIRYTTKPCQSKIITQLPESIGEGRRIRDERHGPTSWVSITLTEGKFRQVRKMTAAVGFPTLRLVRIRVGSLTLQIVLIARALAQDTPIIILDEPTTHLDLVHKVSVFKLLKKLSSETNKCILFSTHDVDLAIQLSDQMIVMTENQVHQDQPCNLITQGVFSSLFKDESIAFDG